MYTIGEISKIVNISANALRYYDEIGLLKPCLIKDDNQYRYYSKEQIKDITFIIELKQYGFTLDEIKNLIKNSDCQNLKSKLEEKKLALFNEIAKLKETSILLDKRISKIIKEENLKMKRVKILIVDDLELARIIIRNILEDYGYTVVGEASNGEEALTAYENLKPDLVIMDIVMPKMDGIDAVKNIIKKYKDAKIIMCSAKSYAPIILDSLKAGGKDFITKPVSSFKLINSITNVLESDSKINLEMVNYAHEALTKLYRKAAFERIFTEAEIEAFINKIKFSNEHKEALENYLKEVYSANYNANAFFIDKSTVIDNDMLTKLKDGFINLNGIIASKLSLKLNTDFIVDLLTVENITVSEFNTVVNNAACLGKISYKHVISPIYIAMHDKFDNEQEIIKEISNIVSNELNTFLPDYKSIDIFSVSNGLLDFIENHPSILVTYMLKGRSEDKCFVEINIPHEILDLLFRKKVFHERE